MSQMYFAYRIIAVCRPLQTIYIYLVLVCTIFHFINAIHVKNYRGFIFWITHYFWTEQKNRITQTIKFSNSYVSVRETLRARGRYTDQERQVVMGVQSKFMRITIAFYLWSVSYRSRSLFFRSNLLLSPLTLFSVSVPISFHLQVPLYKGIAILSYN